MSNSSSTPQRSSDVVKQQIISSLFSGAEDGTTETYIAHIKIWEDDKPGGERNSVMSPTVAPENRSRKPRYIIMAFRRNGRVRLHKAKKIRDGHFSIGRSWLLEELRALEVVDPSTFVMTLNRAHEWHADKPKEQTMFLNAICKVYKKYTNGNLPELINFEPPAPRGTSPSRSRDTRENSRDARDRQSMPDVDSASPSRRRAGSLSAASATSDPRQSSYSNYDSRQSNYLEPMPYEVQKRDPSPAARSPSRRDASPMPMPPSPTAPLRSNSKDSLDPPLPMRDRRDQLRNAARDPSRGSKGSGRASPTRSVSPLHTRTNGSAMGDDASQRSASRQSNHSRAESPAPYQEVLEEPVPKASPRMARRVASPTVSRRDSSPVAPSRSPAPTASGRGTPMGSEASLSAAVTTVRAPSPVQSRSETPQEPSTDSRPGSRRQLRSRRGQGDPPVTEAQQEEFSLMNVEELLQDFDWQGSGNADKLEERLLDELGALEAANIHSIIESDERVNTVISQLEKAIAELDSMDSMLTIYAAELSSMGDDISHIEGQNRGLQVQTANQKALLYEVERLLQTISIPEKELVALKQEPVQSAKGVNRMEKAAGFLYLALQTSLDDSTSRMAAVQERIDEYNGHSEAFCRRVSQHLQVMIQFNVDEMGNDRNRALSVKNPKLYPHTQMVDFLTQYRALVLYMKELNMKTYDDLIASYSKPVGGLYRKEIRDFLAAFKGMVRRASAEDNEAVFTVAFGSPTQRSGTIRRVGTIRSPTEKDNQPGKIHASEAFGRALRAVVPQVVAENDFIRDFFHLGSQNLSFVELIGMDSQLPVHDSNVGMQNGKNDNSRKRLFMVMEGLFEFLPDEMRFWMDAAMRLDNLQLVGILATLEEQLSLYEDIPEQQFIVKMLQKQHQRLAGNLDRFISDQVKAIDETKVTSRKRGIVRRGVVPFIRIFPSFVERIEPQLSQANHLDIRDTVNEAYEKIVQAMFDSLQTMASMVPDNPNTSADEKEQINYHVMMLENMHHFHSELSKRKITVLDAYIQQAKEKYDDNMNAYVEAVVRRPWGKLLEFFEGVETLLKTTAADEVGFHISYNKAALKRTVSSYPANVIRKSVSGDLFKRVDKHFTQEEGLFGAVWNAVEAGMLKDYQRFNDHIQACYPGAGIDLEFNMDDISSAFRKRGG